MIGLIGKKRSGKDTVCHILRQHFGYSLSARIAFADALKEEVAKATETSVPFIEANKEVFRLGLQWWGTEFRRKLHSDNYWIAKAGTKFRDLSLSRPQPRIVVFTDVRFPDEVEFVRSLGGEIWRIFRGMPATSLADTHPSETACDDVSPDMIINNNGTIQELSKYVCAYVDGPRSPSNHDDFIR